MKDNEMTTLSVYLPQHLVNQLKQVATSQNTSVSSVLAQLLQTTRNQTALEKAADQHTGIFG